MREPSWDKGPAEIVHTQCSCLFAFTQNQYARSCAVRTASQAMNKVNVVTEFAFCLLLPQALLMPRVPQNMSTN
jgi:hypothetical protein